MDAVDGNGTVMCWCGSVPHERAEARPVCERYECGVDPETNAMRDFRGLCRELSQRFPGISGFQVGEIADSVSRSNGEDRELIIGRMVAEMATRRDERETANVENLRASVARLSAVIDRVRGDETMANTSLEYLARDIGYLVREIEKRDVNVAAMREP